MRGYGDIIGFQQSGIKNFKIANLNEHKDLFLFAEKHIKELEKKEISFKKYDFLLKIFDRADVINIEWIIIYTCEVPAETINLDACSNVISK